MLPPFSHHELGVITASLANKFFVVLFFKLISCLSLCIDGMWLSFGCLLLLEGEN